MHLCAVIALKCSEKEVGPTAMYEVAHEVVHEVVHVGDQAMSAFS